MTDFTDAYGKPLKKGKLYRYSKKFCVLKDIELKEDKKHYIRGKYLEIEFSTGIRKIYAGALEYFYPVENFDSELEGLEKEVQFLKDNKPQMDASIKLGLPVDKGNTEYTTDMKTKEFPAFVKDLNNKPNLSAKVEPTDDPFYNTDPKFS